MKNKNSNGIFRVCRFIRPSGTQNESDFKIAVDKYSPDENKWLNCGEIENVYEESSKIFLLSNSNFFYCFIIEFRLNKEKRNNVSNKQSIV